MGRASLVGRANGLAEVRLGSQVRHMVEFVEQRSSVLYTVGRRGRGASRMIEVEEWDSRKVGQAERKGQGLGLRRTVVRTTRGSGARHMVGCVRPEGLVGSKFVIGLVGKWSEAGRMNVKEVKGLNPRHMVDQAT